MQNIETSKERQKIRKSIQRVLVLAVFVLLIAVNKKIAFAETTTLTIGGTSVNPSIATSGKGSVGGTWSFAPANGMKNATLTLNNYNGTEIDYSYAPGNLDIVLVGNNVITNNTNSTGFGIYYESINVNTLNIKGSGKLAIYSLWDGIQFNSRYGTNDKANNLVFNANVTIHCIGGAFHSYGKVFINGGCLDVITKNRNAIVVNQFILNAGNVTIKGIGEYAEGVYLAGENSKFEANGGTLTVTTVAHAINAYKGSLYFNEGSHVTAKSSGMWADSIYCTTGQIHFNGGEVTSFSEHCMAFQGTFDTNGNFVYFGDLNSNREMAYYEGHELNTLKRVKNMTLESDNPYFGSSSYEAMIIYPKWKATINTSQTNATLKLTNKTPNFGSGPAKSVTGIRGETISVSVSCAKGKKIANLYYYKKSDPTKKTNISLSTKTFTIPAYDIVVAAKVTDIVKISKIKLNKAKVTIRKGRNYTLRTSIKPSNADDKSLTWKSSNKRVATVGQSGVVTGKRYGTVTITATAKDGSKKKASCKVLVGYSIDYKLNGGTNSKKNPSAYYKQTVTLKEPTRKGYVFKGWYTNQKMTKKIKSISKKSKKNYVLYAKWQKVKAPSSPKISKAQNVTGSNIEVTVKEMRNVDGYQISYATDVTFTENAKTTTTTKQTKTLKNLKKGTTYYIRVRAYKIDSAIKKVYGAYSQIKKVEVKK